MKRAASLLAFITIFLFSSSIILSQETSEEKIELKEKEVSNRIQKRLKTSVHAIIGVWEMHSSERGFIGLLVKGKYDQGKPETTIMIYDKDDNYVGQIDPSGTLKPKGSRQKYTKISKEEAMLYLDALKVIDQVRAWK